MPDPETAAMVVLPEQTRYPKRLLYLPIPRIYITPLPLVTMYRQLMEHLRKHRIIT